MIIEEKFIIGDKFEGILLETFRDGKVSRPRVRPLEYFDQDVKVEFPRSLREENSIGTRFRSDVKICQKTKNNVPYGKPYLVADVGSIIKLDYSSPFKPIIAIKLNTSSDRAYEYIEKEFSKDLNLISFEDFRQKAYRYSKDQPDQILSSSIVTKRLEIIKTYALSRANGRCEACETDAPFLKKNGQPYLEVHHLIELSANGSDAPLNVIAICPNCHKRITYGIDGENFNESLKIKIMNLELQYGN
jgi:hypothetical protein